MFPFKSLADFEIKVDNEVELFRKTLREFVEKEVEPMVAVIEKNNEIPEDLLSRARELGLFGIAVPPDYGGQGGGPLMLAVMMEELSRACPALATSIAVNGLFTTPILLYGSEEQKRKYVVPVAKGEKLAAHANTEPGAGSDIAGIQSVARRDGGHWVLNGRKIFITGASRADYLIVSARTSPPPSKRERWKGVTLFIVEREWPGVRVGQRFNVIGLRGEQPYEVVLEDVRVPDENVVGGVGDGFKIAVETYDLGRVGIAGQAVGIAQAVFEKALNYSLQRRAFERPIISFEGVAFKLADMLIKLEAARLLTYWAATLQERGRRESVIAASLAKTFATEVAEWASSVAIKIHGGAGLDEDTGVARFHRDSLVTTIYEGTNEIQRVTVVRQLLKMVFGASLDLT